MSCSICGRSCPNKLCPKHEKTLMWDSKLQGFRLKKKNNGSRYTKDQYHKVETRLVKIIEHMYGMTNVFTSYHPVWAVSLKKVLYEYDVYVPDKNLLVEYNGQQHYEYVPFFHKRIANFKKQQYRDKIKEGLAAINGYNLVVFKYSDPITKDYVRSRLC